MYLKSLEIQGFKSFPDRIKLDFGKGMTAVVGPNGSGKSNIGDAVRWVLGEQSSKTLRGNKMEDVIFAGTQMRKPVGFAAVTLNIDNTKGLLGVGADEVSVTRKLYRSGESEYLINGSSVRLKDIAELFMDTGLGRDGYSIIGQGRVAEIVSAKSNERREIFEEAAGISKFRYKKAEAERKLNAAQDNILRLKDIIGELESRVEPLRIQSEKAQKFVELSEKRKETEVSVWVSRLNTLRESLGELEEKILVNNTEYENLESDISRFEKQIQDTYALMQENGAKADGLQNDILESERENGRINADIAVLENDIEHAKNAIADLEKQREAYERSGAESDRRTAEAEQKCADTDKAIAAAEEEVKALEKQLEEILSQSGDFDKEYGNIGEKLNGMYIKRSEISAAVSAAELAVKESDEQLELGRKQDESVRAEIEGYKSEREQTSGGIAEITAHCGELDNKLSGYAKLLESRKTKLDFAKEAYEKGVFALKDKQRKMQFLTDLENNMEGFSGSVKAVLKASKQHRISGIRGSVAQIINVAQEYSVAVETALGAAMQNVIVENEDAAKRCIRFLKEENAGRATFLPITSIKPGYLNADGVDREDGFVAVASKIVECEEEFRGITENLLGRIVIAEDIDFATRIAKKYGYKFKIVTLDGQVINAGGSFTGGSQARSAGLLTRKNEIEELSAELEKLKTETDVKNAEVLKYKAEYEKLSLELDAVREEKNTAAQDLITFNSELRRIEAVAAQANSRLEDIAVQLLHFKDKKDEAEKSIDRLKTETSENDKAIAEAEEIVRKNENVKDEFKRRREELSEKLSEARISQVALAKDKEAAVLAVGELKRLAEESKKNAGGIDEAKAKQEALIEEKLAGIEAKKRLITDAGTKADEIKEKIAALQQEHNEFEKKTVDLRAQIRNISDAKEHYSREVTRLSERKVSVQKDYDKIIADLFDQYNLTRTDADAIAEPIENMQEAERALSEIRSKIRSLGTVNVDAIEEYKEVSERYKFMSEQLSDVETSKRELEKLIAELTENMRRMFAESFEAINENFKSIFVELFGGGKAELILTEPEDVLESGIEINVAPPGKVIKNLSLLSGGEQAFVAIAIYFAILRIKPAPFCILDEIEAALDDVNVTKYAKYLRNFTDTTQFIVVTHRRGTMEEADVLYGVTMQEKGISKLLKMERGEVADMALTQ